MSRRRLVLPALLGLVLALPVHAQQTDVEKARAALQKGQAEYNLGNYAEASRYFEEVYRLRPLPALLFNIAQCHRFTGNLDKAATTYRAFLRNAAPNDKNLKRAQELLADVELALQKKAHAENAAPHGLAAAPAVVNAAAANDPRRGTQPAPAQHAAGPVQQQGAASVQPQSVAQAPQQRPPGAVLASAVQPGSHGDAKVAAPSASTSSAPAPAAQPARTRVFTWVAAGSAALALGGGTMFGLKSKSAVSDLSATYHPRSVVDANAAAAKSDAGKANLLFIAGGVLAVTSGVLFALDF